VSCGGAAVNPGDLVVGDADGIVVIEREKAPALIAAAATKVADEKKRFEDIAAGRNLTPKWVEASLRQAGLLKEGERW
jgi:regulator of RNase E activity RraA